MEHKTTKPYRFPWAQVVGFLLSVALTFAAVAIGVWAQWSMTVLVSVVFTLATLQAAIQLFFFMHVTEGSDGKWQVGKMVSAAFIAIVIAAGTVWVMTSMH